ncbi:VOC family protein [Devosia nitrariae]|uniref:Glyoxalase n=1 Tax=Devosia nitrariae TaxID=2071872 RepID=A0ABQ5W9R7_9HYPH|nr:VOC family protein [Devosia nitrariae]GLQ56788.1 glyoxalase [Devosia nitrariae]
MISTKAAMATVAVADFERARDFYEKTLELKPTGTETRDAATYATGGTPLFVYQSQYAGTNQATTVSWDVGGDIKPVLDHLRAKGVTFEHYDFPGVSRDGDIHDMEGFKLAWFKDPDGNIHALMGS